MGKHLVYRLYKEEGLALKKRPQKRRKAMRHREERFRPTAPDQAWSLDFVADQLQDGRRFRALTIVDVFTRESPAIEVGQSLRGGDVVRTLNRVKQERRTPKLLFCDNVLTQEGKAADKKQSLGIPYGTCLTMTVPPSGFHKQGLSVRP